MDYSLAQTLKREVEKYAGSGYGANLRLLPIADESRQIYTVVAIDDPIRQEMAAILVLARLQNSQIIIEEDATDKPLVDALIQAGIPRQQIILAYAGEALPTF